MSEWWDVVSSRLQLVLGVVLPGRYPCRGLYSCEQQSNISAEVTHEFLKQINVLSLRRWMFSAYRLRIGLWHRRLIRHHF